MKILPINFLCLAKSKDQSKNCKRNRPIEWNVSERPLFNMCFPVNKCRSFDRSSADESNEIEFELAADVNMLGK